MKYVLAFILGILSVPLMGDVAQVGRYYTDLSLFDDLENLTMVPRYHVGDVLTKGCTKDVSKNGHGWVFVRREYYKCNKLQIFVSDALFGEYSK